ncbi:hypothetical protein [Actinoplanes sp. NPDC051494]|uniref:hypothetical protein n=1 Tax=Actinoplanes sp. NPDC051494 TaxID=3363907 RepID=UPI0037A4592E
MTGEPGYSSAFIEIPPAEAAAGTTRALWSPSHGSLTITVPAGTVDGAVLWVQSTAGPVAVTVRVAAPFPAPVSGAPQYPPLAATGPSAAPTSGRRNRIIGLGVAALLVLGCCGVIRVMTGDDDKNDVARADTLTPATTTTTTGPAAPVTTVPTTAPATSPDQYAQILARSDAALKGTFGRLTNADAKAFTKAAPGAVAGIRAEAAKLRATAPPAGADGVNTQLAGDLERLGDMVEETADARAECPAASPITEVLQSGWADGIRKGARKLSSADGKYKFGSFLPAAPKDQKRRLKNGNFVKRTSSGGLGHLKVENGADDTTISLVPAKGKKPKPVLTVYVRSGKSFTAKGIRDGTYRIYTASGVDWNAAKKGFTRDCSFSKFDDTFEFSTTSTSSSIWTITLTPVIGGNASTSDVDPDSFPS